MFVKICGVTCAEDAAMVVTHGADALGVNLFPGSKRFVTLDSARPWLGGLAGRILRVAVVVNPTEPELAAVRDADCFDTVQFHGDEPPGLCAGAGLPGWIKALRVGSPADLEAAADFPEARILLDARTADQFGGTGHRLDWQLARKFIAEQGDREIWLAGGLTPNNVAEAIRITKTDGVDTASGVEFAPGRKEEYLVREFIQQARAAARSAESAQR